MKTNKLTIGILLIMSLFLIACVDIEVTTVLNADGSLDRVVEVNSDSEIKEYDELPFPIDSTWKVKYVLDTAANSKNHKYTFEKHYKSANELNADYEKISNSLSKFNRKVKVDKKFRWFYTYISYEETYEKLAKGDYRPFNQYLSDIEKEARKYENGDSIENLDEFDKNKINSYLKDVETKFEKWFEDNLKEEVMIAIEKDILDNQVEGINISELRANSDTIYGIIDSLGGQKMKKAFYESMNGVFNTQEFNKILKAENTELENFEKLLEYIVSQEGFKYKLQMPGLLIDTNTENIKGNQLSWQFEPIEAFFIETSQKAESRVVNFWAYWVSGVFVIVAVLLLVFPIFRKTN